MISDIDNLAVRLLNSLDNCQQIEPITDVVPDFGFAQAYAVSRRITDLRHARGEKTLGRKIGFTNSDLWPVFGVTSPMWGMMYDTTLHQADALREPLGISPFMEPLIEPEIIFGLGERPDADMDDIELLGCVDWVANCFEIVQSAYPGWKFKAADTAAAFGMHGACVVGSRTKLEDLDREKLINDLETFSVTLSCDEKVIDTGNGANVLGSPLKALRHLVETLVRDPASPPLEAGEWITTGSITGAHPVAPGQTWQTEISGLQVSGLRMELG